MHIILQTPRMVIREFSLDEEQVFLNHFTDEEVCLHLPKRTTDERITIFRNAVNNYSLTKKTGTWGMFNKVTGEFIGSCLLRPFDNDPLRIEVGYSMDKKYWGQGLGTEMAKAMVDYAFEDENVIEVVGCTTMENIASQRVLEKAGLKRVDNLLRDGEELAFFVKTRLQS